jgi:phosphatidate cytidylyltransferase
VIPAVVASGLVCGVGLLAPHDAALRGELRVLIPLALLLGGLVVRMGDLRGEATVGAALTLLPVAFVGVPFGLVREIGDEASLARWIAYVVVVAKASDIGGWLVGKPFGRHKLLPSVSPGKSWEGLAGGLGLSVLAAVLLPAPLSIAAEWSGARRVAFGLVLGGASVLAGLLHSAFKRRVGTKDSGRLIPEIGGVLDIVDSMLLAAPAAWLWFRLGLG